MASSEHSGIATAANSHGSQDEEVQRHSRRQKVAEPSTPLACHKPRKIDTVPAAIRGSLMHFSKAEDGKLRWLPPSSSTSSSHQGSVRTRPGSEGTSRSIFCADTAASDMVKPSLTEHPGEIQRIIVSRINPASPQLIPRCRDRADSESSSAFGNTMEVVADDSSSLQEASTTTAVQHDTASVYTQQNTSVSSRLAARSSGRGLSPILTSKLKPGKHVLGQKKHRVFIRPGQLRHWAVANSPALVANLGSSKTAAAFNSNKACRSLLF